MKLCLALLCSSLGWAQLQTNSIEITASRTLNAIPDQASFDVQVATGFGASLSDVVNDLSSVGITAADFASLSPAFLFVSRPNYSLEWDFIFTVPLSNAPSILNQLTALTNKTARISPVSISFDLLGVSTSQANQPMCPINDLVADATAQAQILANAANLRLGPILAISNQSSTLPGTFSDVFSFGIIPILRLSPSQACTATVKFGIVRL